MFRRHRKNKSTVRLNLEFLESRELMSASPLPTKFVYTETENTNPGQNAVIAYAQQGAGQLTQIGSYLTQGTGFTNDGLLGPQDSDKEVIASPDGHLLFAVNQGSNSIADFLVQPDGSLSLVNSAPVNSGGTQPVSLAIAEGRLYVVNRGNEQQGLTATIAPTITVFNIAPDGTLTQNLADTTTLPIGLSPSQLLTVPNTNLLFIDTFTPPPLNTVADANEILPFQIGASGQLVPVSSGGVGTSGASPPVSAPLVLGLALNPNQNIIYAGLTGASQVGVFSFDGSGDLTLVDTVPLTLGGAAPCWSAVSPNGQFLYTVDTGTNSVGVFSLADPLHPTQIQELALGGQLNSAGAVSPTAPRETTDFEFSFDPTGNTLYVIDHQSGTAGDFPDGNALHTLTVASNGTLSEQPNSPAYLPVGIPFGADPQGVAVIFSAGPGATIVGNSLYLIGGNTNDYLNITPIGASQTGSTGIKVNGQLDNINLNSQTFTQAFTTIYIRSFDGNDNIQFAANLTVPTVIRVGDGNANLLLDNGPNTVTLGKGNDNVLIGNGNCNAVTFGNGNDNLVVGNGSFNTISLGNGNDNVVVGNGSFDSLTCGNGNDNVVVGNGSFGSLTFGHGNDNVVVGNGSFDSLTFGNGNDNVVVGNGSFDSLTLGNGNDNVVVGNGSFNSLTCGNGNDNVVVGNGSFDSLTLGNGNDNVFTGNGSGTLHIGSGYSHVHLGSSGWTQF